MSHAAVSSATSSGLSFLMLTAFAQKVFTTFLNTALIRFVSADVMGFAANDMELLLSTILFLSREAFRKVADRYPAKTLLKDSTAAERQKRSQLIAASLMPVPLGLTFASLAALGYSYCNAGRATSEEGLSFYLFCLAAAIDTIVGPLFILTVSCLWHGIRAKADVFSTVAQCLTTFILAYRGFGALSFAVGRLALSLTLLAVYSLDVTRELKAAASKQGILSMLYTGPQWKEAFSSGFRRFFPSLLGEEPFSLVLAFFGQGLVKHLLTEGDRILLTMGGSRDTRGLYAVISNYGSLAARLLFAPMEESVRRATAQSGLADWLMMMQKDKKDKKTTKASLSPPPAAGIAALGLFKRYSFIVLWIGLVAVSFGPFLSSTFVRLVLGQRWIETTPAASALAVYCCYVLFMALNGVTEAFADAISDPSRLITSNLVLFGAFAVYATTAVGYALPRYGTVGLIVCGCLNMAIRTFSSWLYIRKSVKAIPLPSSPSSSSSLRLREVFPSFPVVAACASAFVCLGALSYSAFSRSAWAVTDSLLPVATADSRLLASSLLSPLSVFLETTVLHGRGLVARHLFLIAVAAVWGLLVVALTLLFDAGRAIPPSTLQRVQKRLPWFLAKRLRLAAEATTKLD